MLLGFAFLMIAFMGAFIFEDALGGFLLIIGVPLGLIYCIIGCYDEQLSSFFKKQKNEKNEEKKE
ncbi:MAG: hypothetical protein IKD43_01025 [Clostridia bacterium]|nr:hypothetical protein [Clostridia bacterium]